MTTTITRPVRPAPPARSSQRARGRRPQHDRSLGGQLDAALAELAWQPLRAFARLQLSALAAGTCAGVGRPPAFVAIGPVSAGTGRVAELVSALSGGDPAAAILSGRTATPQTFALRVARAAEARIPYLCCAGWERAPLACQQLTGGLVLGDERSPAGALAAVYVTLNVRRVTPELIHPRHLHGAIVLDATRPRGVRRRYGARRPAPGPAALPFLDAEFQASGRSEPALEGFHYELALELRGLLAQAGRREVDPGLLVPLAVGRAVLTGRPVDHAVLRATVADYVSCAETLGRRARGR